MSEFATGQSCWRQSKLYDLGVQDQDRLPQHANTTYNSIVLVLSGELLTQPESSDLSNDRLKSAGVPVGSSVFATVLVYYCLLPELGMLVLQHTYEQSKTLLFHSNNNSNYDVWILVLEKAERGHRHPNSTRNADCRFYYSTSVWRNPKLLRPALSSS